MVNNTIKNKFANIFGEDCESIFFAPGRINLIGEHTDYNGGFVFPCPITLGTYAAVSKRKDKIFKVYSMNFEDLGVLEFSLDNLEYNKKHDWANYLKGVIKFLLENNHKINYGLNIVIYGNLPNGAGLSSSASLEMLSAKILKDSFHLDFDNVQAALLGRTVENKYIGVNSGIMDQFAISLGQKDKAIMLDCNNLFFEYVPLNLINETIIIMNTNKRRELADSKYNERRAECDSALESLKTILNINSLCELTPEEFEKHKHVINDEIKIKRAKHAIYENERVKAAVKALKNNHIVTFGKLMNDSHNSLRDDYEVTGIELDTLVHTAWKQESVLGARMTGAGFGGCAIAIVKNDSVNSFIENVGKVYKDTIGYEASFYIASIGNGPIKL
ncbi:galactokinase [Clostridium tarantellae]|uniref:Galactokinase n=1 Tax=Clostridium tarantellae TaxID=39493 RepID=A0A6I1MM96_9CLOT|nr:galactokinase [Clostridium tarantellae]MPQ44626.1 galactokinase [Clostridium tarantellae]